MGMTTPLFTTGATYLAGAGGAVGAGTSLGALGAAAGPLGAVIGLAPLLIRPKKNGLAMMNGLSKIGSTLSNGVFDLSQGLTRPMPSLNGQFDGSPSFLVNQLSTASSNPQQRLQIQQRQQQIDKSKPYSSGSGLGLFGPDSNLVNGLNPKAPFIPLPNRPIINYQIKHQDPFAALAINALEVSPKKNKRLPELGSNADPYYPFIPPDHY